MPDVARAAAHLRHAAHHEKAAYTQGEERPLGSFISVMGAYGAAVGLGTAIVKAVGADLPERIDARDLALYSVATHKLSRLIAKDPVTSPLRAPFTTFDGTSGEAELQEQVRGSGPRKAIGELITCPFCLAQWTATGFAFGHVVAPRVTRLVASVFAMVAVSDALQFGYDALQPDTDES